MKVSLIIATFNNPAFLELVLESALRQNYPLHEIIVCEDGQFSKNKELIESFTKRSHAPVIHIHHADQDNRKPLCVNKGILASSGEYLVFVDGDCVLRCDFVSDHVKLASTDSFLTGRRVELSQKATLLIDAGKIRSGYLDSFPWKLYLDALTGKTEHLGRFFKTKSE